MADVDFSGVLNPKRVLAERESRASEPQAEPPAPPQGKSAIPFTKAFTPAERAKQRAALADALRNRADAERAGN